MRRLIPITEQFQHYLESVKESFWGDLYQRTRLAWEKFLEAESLRERDRHLGVKDYERADQRRGYRNGFYTRRLVTVFGTLKIRVARTRFSAAGVGALPA